MEIVEREKPDGVIVQVGGQTPLNLAMRLLAQLGAGTKLPREGTVFISVNDQDKREDANCTSWDSNSWPPEERNVRIEREGLPCQFVYKAKEGRPNIVDLVKSRQINLVINTPLGRASFYDEREIRRSAMQYSVPCITTMTGATAAVAAIRSLREEEFTVRSLQEYHAK